MPFPRPPSGSGGSGCCSLQLCFSKYMQNSKASLSSSWQSLLSSPSKKKKTHCDVKLLLPGPFLYKWSVSDSETYGLRFPGKTLTSSRANLAKDIGGGGGASPSGALERSPEVLNSTIHPPSASGVLGSAHPKAQTLCRVKKTLWLRSFMLL